MAKIHPRAPLHAPLTAGDYRERDILRLLEEGLPDSFDVFHNLPWSAMHDGHQGFGEYDIVVVSPGAHLLILEVKAGEVEATATDLVKTYGAKGPRSIGHQMRRMHSSLLDRRQEGALPQVQVGALLVLPDQHLQSDIVAYPRERVLDASQVKDLCRIIRSSFDTDPLPDDQRRRVMDFLENRFDLVPDVATHIGQIQYANTHLASGLATWVGRIRHPDNLYCIEATAGSGKTQLALRLLREAAAANKRALYVCFNRPLADHLARMAPPACEAATFHQLCRDHAERHGASLDFSDPLTFERMTDQYMADAAGMTPRLDLLIIDESQDMALAWVEALMQSLLPTGHLYVMGDSQQQLYERESFDLADAVQIRCTDNFRSPQRVVQMINQLKLSQDRIEARSALMGELPELYIWSPGKSSALGQLNECLHALWQAGYKPEQVAVISYRGVQQSEVLRQSRLGGFATRRFTGNYDAAGNAVWTDGDLLCESLYRFKGQSAPAIVLCEVDFESLTEKDKRKLFVGLTRAQMRVDIVMSERAAHSLLAAE